jgi:hypothetical protein
MEQEKTLEHIHAAYWASSEQPQAAAGEAVEPEALRRPAS